MKEQWIEDLLRQNKKSLGAEEAKILLQKGRLESWLNKLNQKLETIHQAINYDPPITP